MERQRILQAFYEDEVSSSTLGSEQKRIDSEITELKGVIDEATKAHTSAQRSYRAALELVTTLDLEKAYMNAHPLLRRYLNQALFTKIRIDDTDVAVVKGRFGSTREHDVRVLGAEVHPRIDHQRLAQAVIGLTMDKANWNKPIANSSATDRIAFARSFKDCRQVSSRWRVLKTFRRPYSVSHDRAAPVR